jgi:predicted amidohydrolase
MTSDEMAEFDLIVRGGRVIDPASGIDGLHEVAVTARSPARPRG